MPINQNDDLAYRRPGGRGKKIYVTVHRVIHPNVDPNLSQFEVDIPADPVRNLPATRAIVAAANRPEAA